MNQYDIEINNDKLNVSVVNEACVIDEYVSELKKLLKDQSRVVGLDCKRKAANSEVSLLIMCVSNRCLIIQCDLFNVPKSLTEFFADESIPFVGMETSFSIKWQGYINVGTGTDTARFIRSGYYSFNSGVKLGDLASRVLMKPELLKSGIAELAGHVDLKTSKTSRFGSQSSTSITPQSSTSNSNSTITSTSSNITCCWRKTKKERTQYNSNTTTSTATKVYSEEQMKEVVHDAYYSYLIASKLLEMP